MDADRFDAAVRLMTATPSRRSLLGRATSGLLLALGLAISSADATLGKRRKRKKKKKKCRGCRACTECIKGRCRAVPNFTPCGGVCQECQGGQCVNKADNTPCTDDGRCLDGLCNPEPDCDQAGVGGCVVLQDCCSGVCSGSPPFDVCLEGAADTDCIDDSDCISHSCVGYRCY